MWSSFEFWELIKYKIPNIIIEWIINRPLKPSIKLHPLITNNKAKQTNIEEIILWLFIRLFRVESWTLNIFISKKKLIKNLKLT